MNLIRYLLAVCTTYGTCNSFLHLDLGSAMMACIGPKEDWKNGRMVLKVLILYSEKVTTVSVERGAKASAYLDCEILGWKCSEPGNCCSLPVIHRPQSRVSMVR